MKTLFLTSLFLFGTIVCFIPAQASELRSDSVCTFDARLSRPGDYLRLIDERNQRERHYATPTGLNLDARSGAVALPAVNPTSLTRRERVALAEAVGRFVHENSGTVVDVRTSR